MSEKESKNEIQDSGVLGTKAISKETIESLKGKLGGDVFELHVVGADGTEYFGYLKRPDRLAMISFYKITGESPFEAKESVFHQCIIKEVSHSVFTDINHADYVDCVASVIQDGIVDKLINWKVSTLVKH